MELLTCSENDLSLRKVIGAIWLSMSRQHDLGVIMQVLLQNSARFHPGKKKRRRDTKECVEAIIAAIDAHPNAGQLLHPGILWIIRHNNVLLDPKSLATVSCCLLDNLKTGKQGFGRIFLQFYTTHAHALSTEVATAVFDHVEAWGCESEVGKLISFAFVLSTTASAFKPKVVTRLIRVHILHPEHHVGMLSDNIQFQLGYLLRTVVTDNDVLQAVNDAYVEVLHKTPSCGAEVGVLYLKKTTMQRGEIQPRMEEILRYSRRRHWLLATIIRG